MGSIFLSVQSADPRVLLGYGTWEALSAGYALVTVDTDDATIDTALKEAGANSATPDGTVSQPTFSGSQASLTHSGTAVSAHSGAAVADHAAHTHSVTSDVAVADHASHTHTYTQVPNHTHPHNLQGGTTGATTGTNVMASTATGGSSRTMAIATSNPTGGVASATTAGPGATLSHSVTNNAATSGNPSATLSHSVTQPSAHSVTQPNDHTHTPAGTVSQPTFSGASLSVRQKSLAVHAWRRTA